MAYLGRWTLLLLLVSLPAVQPASSQGGVEEQIRTCFDNARKAEQNGEVVRAESEYRQALGLSLSRIGGIAARLGDYATAERAYGECLQAISVSEAGLMGLGTTYLRSGQYEKGIETAQKLLDFDPFNQDARRLLGKIYLMQKNYPEAAKALKDVNDLKEDAGTSYALALAYMNLGRLEDVRKLFNRIPELVGDTPQVHLMFGRAYREIKQVDLALEEFRQALALDPKLKRGHYYMGLTYLSAEANPDVEKAMEEFKLEAAANPKEFPPQFFLGTIYARQRKFDDAVKYLNRATELNPLHFRARYLLGLVLSIAQRPEEAIPELKAALALSDPTATGRDRADAQYQLGQALRRAGRMGEAQEALKIAQEMKLKLTESDRASLEAAPLATMDDVTDQGMEKPGEAGLELIEPPLESFEREELEAARPVLANLAATAYNGLALLDASKSDLGKALTHFRLAAAWDDSVPDVCYNLGLAYFRQHNLTEAIPALEKALEKDPAKIATRRLLGVARFMQKDYAGAVEQLAAVVGDSPEKDPQASYSLALALVQTGRVDESLGVVDRLLTNGPKMAELYVLKGQIMGQRGEYAPAIEAFNQALALKPGLPDVNFFAGMAYLRQSEFDLAVQKFEQELKRDPNHIQAKYHIAFIAVTKNEKDKAVPLLQEVLRMNPNHSEALYQLGKIQLEQGNVPPAVANLETAANLEPQKPYIFYQLYRAYLQAGRTDDAQQALKRYQALKGR